MNPLVPKVSVSFAGRLAFVLGPLFLAAGTFNFPQAWAFLSVFFISQLLTMIYLLKRDPGLLNRRLQLGAPYESRTLQKASMLMLHLSVVIMFVVAGLDHRFHWSRVPMALVIAADLVILIGFYIQFSVFKENSFASAVVKVLPEQRVISTGPYAIVRHPMYSAGLLINLFTSIALGSWWGLPLSLVWLIAILIRLLDEEKLLCHELPGYVEYCQKVRHRLIPPLLKSSPRHRGKIPGSTCS